MKPTSQEKISKTITRLKADLDRLESRLAAATKEAQDVKAKHLGPKLYRRRLGNPKPYREDGERVNFPDAYGRSCSIVCRDRFFLFIDFADKFEIDNGPAPLCIRRDKAHGLIRHLIDWVWTGKLLDAERNK